MNQENTPPPPAPTLRDDIEENVDTGLNDWYADIHNAIISGDTGERIVHPAVTPDPLPNLDTYAERGETMIAEVMRSHGLVLSNQGEEILATAILCLMAFADRAGVDFTARMRVAQRVRMDVYSRRIEEDQRQLLAPYQPTSNMNNEEVPSDGGQGNESIRR